MALGLSWTEDHGSTYNGFSCLAIVAQLVEKTQARDLQDPYESDGWKFRQTLVRRRTPYGSTQGNDIIVPESV